MKSEHSKPEIPETLLMQWQALADILAKICQVPAALIMKVHSSEIEVFVCSHADDNPYEHGEKAPLNTGLYCEEVMRRRDGLLVPDALQDPNWDHNPDIKLGMISYLGYPLIWPDGEVFGTLCILDKKENPYSADIHELIRRFREVVETSMAFLWERERRRLSEEVLQQSEERNRFLAEVIENSSQPFGTGYPDGRLGIVNRAFCDLTGYTEEELRHIDWNVTLTPPEWLESEIQHLTELERTGKPVRYEKEYIRKDGTRVPIELLVHVVRGETGETLHYQAFVTDLTERKKAEGVLKESEQRFRIIFDRAPLGIAVLGLDFRLLRANKAYCDLLGYSEGELRQLHIGDFTHPDDLDENLRLQRELGSGKIPSFQMEKRFIHKGGKISFGLLVASLLSDDSGIPQYFIGLVLDITDRKKAEEAVRVSEERFRLAMEATADGVWDWDLKTDNVFRSPGFFSMLGYQEEEFRGHFGEWQNLVHPEDLEAVRCALDEYLAGTRKNYEVEFRMFEKSGGTVWILSRGKVVARDESGRPLRMVGTHSDITERKRSEGELQENENRLKHISSMISDIAYSCFKQPSGAYSIDWMTEGVEHLTGYSVDDLKSLGACRRTLYIFARGRYRACS